MLFIQIDGYPPRTWSRFKEAWQMHAARTPKGKWYSAHLRVIPPRFRCVSCTIGQQIYPQKNSSGSYLLLRVHATVAVIRPRSQRKTQRIGPPCEIHMKNIYIYQKHKLGNSYPYTYVFLADIKAFSTRLSSQFRTGSAASQSCLSSPRGKRLLT